MQIDCPIDFTSPFISIGLFVVCINYKEVFNMIHEDDLRIESLLRDCEDPFDLDPCKGCTCEDCTSCFEGGASEDK